MVSSYTNFAGAGGREQLLPRLDYIRVANRKAPSWVAALDVCRLAPHLAHGLDVCSFVCIVEGIVRLAYQ